MRPQTIVTSRPCDHSGGAHPIGVWAHTQERRHGRLPITLVWVGSISTIDVGKAKCYCRLGGPATCGLKRRSKTPQPSQLPSRLFPLSDMFVIPSAWDFPSGPSGDGCNLQETSKLICAAMPVYSRPLERLGERPVRYRDERRPHTRGETSCLILLQARQFVACSKLVLKLPARDWNTANVCLVADVTFKRRLELDRSSLRTQ